MCIIELVGPAGAGKTTILKALLDSSKTITTTYPPSLSSTLSIKSIINTFSVTKLIIHALPTLFCFHNYKNNQRHFNISEISYIAVLTGWHHSIQKRMKKDGRTIVLDQGPVYMLSQLHQLGHEYHCGILAKKRWEQMYRRWSRVIDMIVYLDTHNNYLIKRINQRSKWHTIKDITKLEADTFLHLYRKSYKHVISIFAHHQSGLKLLRYDTQIESLDTIVYKLMIELKKL